MLSPIVIDRNGEAMLLKEETYMYAEEEGIDDMEDDDDDLSEIEDDLMLTKSEGLLQLNSN